MALKIGIGLIFYNDFDSLRRFLQSLQSYPFDRLIAVDGRFKGHTGKTPLSDKKTRDLFKGFQTPYVIIDAPDISQIEKRQIYLDKSEEYDLDVLIVLDSDEFIRTDLTNWPLFIEELSNILKANRHTYIQGYTIPSYVNQKRYGSMDDYVINVSRVFYRPHTLKYVESHFEIRNKTTGVKMFYQSDTTVLQHLIIGTDHKLRGKEYMKQHDDYETWQMENEENRNEINKRIDAFIKERDGKPIIA